MIKFRQKFFAGTVAAAPSPTKQLEMQKQQGIMQRTQMTNQSRTQAQQMIQSRAVQRNAVAQQNLAIQKVKLGLKQSEQARKPLERSLESLKKSKDIELKKSEALAKNISLFKPKPRLVPPVPMK